MAAALSHHDMYNVYMDKEVRRALRSVPAKQLKLTVLMFHEQEHKFEWYLPNEINTTLD